LFFNISPKSWRVQSISQPTDGHFPLLSPLAATAEQYPTPLPNEFNIHFGFWGQLRKKQQLNIQTNYTGLPIYWLPKNTPQIPAVSHGA